MHPHQLRVTGRTVSALVGEQFPQWSQLGVKKVTSAGTVNALFRVGDELVVRLPLVGDDVDTTRGCLEREAAAARELAGRLPCPTPEPVAIGEPGAGYPLPWSVVTWLPGVVATAGETGSSLQLAENLVELIHGLRSIGTRDRTFTGSGRGGDLAAHDRWVGTCLERSRGLLDVGALRALWGRLRQLPRVQTDLMTHGDLTPSNLLVERGRLVGVLDVGGFGPADPALDLVVAWHLLEKGPRSVLRNGLSSDDLEWERGKAWAFEQAIGAVWYYQRSNPTMSHMGRRTLEHLLRAEGATA